ncbi:MAG: FtsL-like putative cell division protein [Paludibacteraceae bacterium]
MSRLSKIWDTIKGSEDFSDIKSSSLRDILNGNILKKRFLQKQYGLFILIAILTVIYVDNRYSCETQIAREVKLKKELQDVKFESLTISAELTTLSRRSYVLNYIRENGLLLKESPVAPIVITTPGEENEKALKDSMNKILYAKQDTVVSIALD